MSTVSKPHSGRKNIDEAVFLPTPEEISRLTEEIRSTWSPYMLRKRCSEVSDVQLMEVRIETRDGYSYRE